MTKVVLIVKTAIINAPLRMIHRNLPPGVAGSAAGAAMLVSAIDSDSVL
ncbi:hypothetical protein RBJ75_27370 [Rhodopseudomonas sp. BAL398]|nr:hypothetical protein [Rhodopseudomonas sp. BAL398]WOK17790.1 hypothetical protein RBJ75_27370 [Rhodopseudomonas sp. BAL398]